jgi:hypothetical protein
MKISILLSALLTSLSGFAAAQSVVASNESTSTVAQSENVFAENTIAPVSVNIDDEQAAPAESESVVNFAQEFTSETSEEALLSHVSRAVAQTPDKSCEIVKAAITVSKADEKLVAKIVESAALAAPEKMRLIAQCAMAASPDSLDGIQQVMAKLDPGAGDACISGKEVSEKGGFEKGAIPSTPVAPVYDPLRRAYIQPIPPMIIPPVATDNDHRN